MLNGRHFDSRELCPRRLNRRNIDDGFFNRNARLAEPGVVIPALGARIAPAGKAEAKQWFLRRRRWRAR